MGLYQNRYPSIHFYIAIAKNLSDNNNIKPALEWFNAILDGMCNSGMIDFAMKILSEDMCDMNIKPSIETYRHFINCFTHYRGNNANLIEIKNRVLFQYSLLDTEFAILLLSAFVKQKL